MLKKEHRQGFPKPRGRKTDPVVRAWFMVLVLISVVGTLMYIDYQRRALHDPFETPPPGRFAGNPNGELKITQFLDFKSPECGLGQRLIKEYMAKRPDEIFLQTRYFPQDEDSISAAVYAECANHQKAFWRFTDILFQSQSRWVNLPGEEAVLKAIVQEMGLDMKAFNQCVATTDPASDILVDRAYGESLFVRSTPSYFLNGKLIVGVDALRKAMRIWGQQVTDDD